MLRSLVCHIQVFASKLGRHDLRGFAELYANVAVLKTRAAGKDKRDNTMRGHFAYRIYGFAYNTRVAW